jgi:hypothetical protein
VGSARNIRPSREGVFLSGLLILGESRHFVEVLQGMASFKMHRFGKALRDTFKAMHVMLTKEK